MSGEKGTPQGATLGRIIHYLPDAEGECFAAILCGFGDPLPMIVFTPGGRQPVIEALDVPYHDPSGDGLETPTWHWPGDC